MKINFKITTECPANCSCCQERLENYRSSIKTNEQYDKVIRNIENLLKKNTDSENFVSINGGEPTLIPDLDVVVKRFKAYDCTVGIDTNGWNIDRKWLAKMEEAGLDYILISIYSLDKQTFNMLRGVTNDELFTRVMKAMSEIKKYKERDGGIQIRFNTVIMKSNYKELPELLNFAIFTRCNSLSTAYYTANSPNDMLRMNFDDIMELKKMIVPELLNILKKYELNEELYSANEAKLRKIFEFENVSSQDIGNGIYRCEGYRCNLKNRMILYPNGDVAPCTFFDYLFEPQYIDNIFEIDICKINMGEKFMAFWNESHTICRNCTDGYQLWLMLN